MEDLSVINTAALMPASYKDKLAFAEILVKSHLIPSVYNTPESVCAALEMGHELGLNPMSALNNISVINGKACLNTDAMCAVARRSKEWGGLKWNVATDEKADVTVYRRSNGIVEEYKAVFTWDNAVKAGLVNKDNWKKFPARMLQKRALSFALRDAFPDLLMGIYDRDEISPVSENETAGFVQVNDYKEEPKPENKIAKPFDASAEFDILAE